MAYLHYHNKTCKYMPSGMEPDVRDLLKRVGWTIGIVFLYFMINATIGIALEWAFFDGSPTLGNYIFYGWLALTTIGMILLLRKWWKKKFPHG